jgi:chorismate mutase
MDISDWRIKIDSLDEQITALLNQRAAAAVEIGRLKSATAAPVYEPQREEQVYEHVSAVNPGPLTDTELNDIYQRIMDVMRAKQRPTT